MDKGSASLELASPLKLASVKHPNRFPTRLAMGPDGSLYVSDARSSSVFQYDQDLKLIGELPGLKKPLGIIVDLDGNIYVGNNGRNNIEVYSPDGELLRIITGGIKMPNDLDIDETGRLYVADSLGDTVRVFNAETGDWIRNIGSSGNGEGELSFPAAVMVAYREIPGGSTTGELFVADQGNNRIQIFDLGGTWLRSFGTNVEAFSSDWAGKFVKIQSLSLDALGRLHAADNYLNTVQILDTDTGAFLDSYGSFGTSPGELNLPLDILITPEGRTIVANSGNGRVEVVFTVQ